ncbi:MAG: hypothetical protein KAT00_15460, partial [Planctomycetes bacterium]|nr:hypothetical protein [Planctomycetota bacterium]
EWNLENGRLLENDIRSKCPDNVYRDEKNNPRCRIEDDDPAGCKLAGDGRCGKWRDSMFDGK